MPLYRYKVLYIFYFLIISRLFLYSVSFHPDKHVQVSFPTALLTLVELVLCVFASTDGQHHLPQQRQGTSHLLLTHPVLHEAEVGVVGRQQPQQSRMQTWRQSSTTIEPSNIKEWLFKDPSGFGLDCSDQPYDALC